MTKASFKAEAARIIRDLMLPFVFKRAAMSWLFDYHIYWDEPLSAAA